MWGTLWSVVCNLSWCISEMKDGNEGGKITGFDIDSQSGTQEPQPRHSYCSVVNPALYSPGTLQLRRNNSTEIKEMMGLVYLSCRMKMIASKISIHDAFCWGKELLKKNKKIKCAFQSVISDLSSISKFKNMLWMSWCWIWKIISYIFHLSSST